MNHIRSYPAISGNLDLCDIGTKFSASRNENKAVSQTFNPSSVSESNGSIRRSQWVRNEGSTEVIHKYRHSIEYPPGTESPSAGQTHSSQFANIRCIILTRAFVFESLRVTSLGHKYGKPGSLYKISNGLLRCRWAGPVAWLDVVASDE